MNLSYEEFCNGEGLQKRLRLLPKEWDEPSLNLHIASPYEIELFKRYNQEVIRLLMNGYEHLIL